MLFPVLVSVFYSVQFKLIQICCCHFAEGSIVKCRARAKEDSGYEVAREARGTNQNVLINRNKFAKNSLHIARERRVNL